MNWAKWRWHSKAQGIALGYHNHHWELRPKEDGRTALEWLFEGARDSPLAWQVDVAWLARGGVDPAAWMLRYRDRVASAHKRSGGQILRYMGFVQEENLPRRPGREGIIIALEDDQRVGARWPWSRQ